MRIIVMFDLPVKTSVQKRIYRQFRKKLLKSGFFMLQESVYSKLAPNTYSADAIINKIKKDKPPEGSVMALRVTEKQFSKMEYIVGERQGNVIDSDERLIIL